MIRGHNFRKTVYFNGLTELRAVAAIAVVVYHIELYKFGQHEPTLFTVPFLGQFMDGLGPNAVFLFFVLSGFLITYLLLEEKANTGTIGIRKFYVRRILRIWPLYYIIIGISFFIVPLTYNHSFWIHEINYQERIGKLNYGGNLVLCLFFLSNLAMLIYKPIVGAAHSWSVSAEEQFYFFWPAIVMAFDRYILAALLSIAILKPLLLILLIHLFKSSSPGLMVFITFLDGMKFEYMAIGGILAYIFQNKKDIADKFFRSTRLFGAAIIILSISLFFYRFTYINALLFALIIGFVIHSDWNSPILKKLGEVSYGIYMYHPIMMYISFAAAHNLLKKPNSLWALILEYLLVFILTYLVSLVSYRWIESYFLKLKSKFSVIHSQSTLNSL
ncbi:acyltransferase [Mucilaginibacter sabulilitoris]|uniref:Acyltransferase n=1 Tax=Mucilaginibacter sabulilitoris TaxID=1173583 RepID=A0ABZ0TS51_9SPHI|nr:acyltransferase [Mucilaginibacter sabulilitoris]WPU95791.1 acyltransferase [Mucilaginibacter sabulilitoris]